MNNDINVFEIPIGEEARKAMSKMNVGTTVFDDDDITPAWIPGAKEKGLREYIPWGDDNLRPNEVLINCRKDEVMSSNMLFNILCGYSNGLMHNKPDKTPTTDPDILEFFKYNRATKYLFEQQTDMKHFYFTVSVLILNGDGTKIVRLRHKDALYCRFEKCNDTGKIEHVFFGVWDDGAPGIKKIEVIECLDVDDPLGDLEVRLGVHPNDEGKKETPTKVRKFAMVNKIPIPGNKYYPFPYYWAVFNSGWFDIKQMIPAGKKAKFTNGLVIKYQVEINSKYWDLLFSAEKITDPEKQKERAKTEKENIKNFLTGMVHAGKVWFSGYYTTPDGKENSMIRINMINNTKEGGDWLEDQEESSNTMCYAMGVHPSSIGANPGKTSSNMSGSNVREIFTMKQALEKAPKDIILEPYYVIKHFNKWDVEFDIPFMMLTTLDKKTDAVPSDENSQQTKKP